MPHCIRPIVTLALALAVSITVLGQAPRKVTLTGNDTLQYTPATITARPGERITVVLRTMSMQPAAQMAHNFVILKPDADQAMFVMMAGMARDTGFIPAALKNQILVATDMAVGGETVTATFTVPTKPGTYPFFCTFPAHFNGGMKGVLVVK